MLANRRKAYASRGDDATLTRFVKTEGFHQSAKKTAPMPASATGTRFPGQVVRPHDAGNLLVSGHSNMKLGRDVRKGKLQGYWIYTLSLEERATCPRSCEHWLNCYGNSLHMDKRVDHTDPAFLPMLEAEIASLLATRGRKGILIRLHALGDFYSVDYVDFWHKMLALHPRLAIFGYTARNPAHEDAIGHRLDWLNCIFSARSMIRFSNSGHDTMSTVHVRDDIVPAGAFACPEQTGATACCATCAACWSTTKNVGFRDH